VTPQGRNSPLPFAGLQPTIGDGAEKNCEEENQKDHQKKNAWLIISD
jgi:hypothetical protein